MDLVQINIIHAEPPQAVINRVQDMLAREPLLVGIVSQRKENFSSDDHTVSRWPKVLERASQDLLANAQRVHVCSVEKIDAQLQRALDERAAFIFFQYPLTPLLCAVRHAAEADARDFCAGGTQVGVLHG